MKKKWKRIGKRMIWIIALIGVVGAVTVFGINALVKQSAGKYIFTAESAEKDYDCILILGCGVKNNAPSRMLRDRLNKGIELYQNGVSGKFLMSGDHGREDYDEVRVMKDYVTEAGVLPEDVFLDHAGFSTYESMYRAKEVFEAKKILIVTQEYHLYRAVYDARRLGLDAYGVAAEGDTYSGQTYRNLREILSRNKDFFYCIEKPKPTYLGETIPVSGDGNVTDDE